MADTSDAFEQGLDTGSKDPFGDDDGLSEFDAEQGAAEQQPVATDRPLPDIPLVSAETGAPIEAQDAEQEVPTETREEAEQREATEAGEHEAERRSEIEALTVSDLIALIEASDKGSLDYRLAAEDRTRRVTKQREEKEAEQQAEKQADAAEKARVESPTPAASTEPVAAEGKPVGDERPTQAGTSPAAEIGTTGAGEHTRAEPSEPDAAAPPAEVQNAAGAVTHRRYVLLTPSGNGTFKEVHWLEDEQGKMVAKGTPGAKKQTRALARGQEDALDIGFRAMGSPEDGCKVVAVAETYFQVRHVQPDPDPPVRRKLVIR